MILKNKTAIVTGASTGLGNRFARFLSENGARTILVSRNFEKIKDLERELKNSFAIKIDISKKDQIQSLFKDLESKNEKIDICINNAGIGVLTNIFDEEDDDNFEDNFKTNVFGTFYMTKYASIHMRNNKISGSIINIGSPNGENILYKGCSGYASSKSAVIHMTKSMVKELAEYKIRINCINPGIFEVESKKRSEELKKYIPFNEIGNPCYLDDIVLYLCDNSKSRYVTGSIFNIDGGLSNVFLG